MMILVICVSIWLDRISVKYKATALKSNITFFYKSLVGQSFADDQREEEEEEKLKKNDNKKIQIRSQI